MNLLTAICSLNSHEKFLNLISLNFLICKIGVIRTIHSFGLKIALDNVRKVTGALFWQLMNTIVHTINT